MDKIIFDCGHDYNCLTIINSQYACDICLKPVSFLRPGLTGRKAKCYCGKETDSDKPLKGYMDIPFFRYCPDKDYDNMYCGCKGFN